MFDRKIKIEGLEKMGSVSFPGTQASDEEIVTVWGFGGVPLFITHHRTFHETLKGVYPIGNPPQQQQGLPNIFDIVGQ